MSSMQQKTKLGPLLSTAKQLHSSCAIANELLKSVAAYWPVPGLTDTEFSWSRLSELLFEVYRAEIANLETGKLPLVALKL